MRTILALNDPSFDDELDPEFDPEPFEEARQDLVLRAFEYDDMMDGYVRSTYVGTVFALCPSGKYYMPFACSNVTPCPKCKGKGCDYCGELGSREAYLDQLWWEAAEEWADSRGLCVGSGEGAASDVVLYEVR